MGDSDDNKSGCLIDNNDIGNEGKMFVGGLSKSTTVEGMREYFDK
jgi:RNA recognition motif-containing protein